jgi:hypothetical protein
MIWLAAALLLALILWITHPFFGQRQAAVATRLAQDRERLEFLFRSLASAQKTWEAARMVEEDFRSIEARLLQQMARLLATNPALLDGWQPEQNKDLKKDRPAEGAEQGEQTHGAVSQRAGEATRCSSCAEPLSNDFSFCPQCGAKRGETAP